jgi:hypothetical protein
MMMGYAVMDIHIEREGFISIIFECSRSEHPFAIDVRHKIHFAGFKFDGY